MKETADKQQMLNSLSAEVRAVVADARNATEKLHAICSLIATCSLLRLGRLLLC
jgi:hypothetical protein